MNEMGEGLAPMWESKHYVQQEWRNDTDYMKDDGVQSWEELERR